MSYFYGTGATLDNGNPKDKGFFGTLSYGDGDANFNIDESSNTIHNYRAFMGWFRALKQAYETIVERLVFFSHLGASSTLPQFQMDIDTYFLDSVGPSVKTWDRRNGQGWTSRLEMYNRLNAIWDIVKQYVDGVGYGYSSASGIKLICLSMDKIKYNVVRMYGDPRTGWLSYDIYKDYESQLKASFQSWCKNKPIGEDILYKEMDDFLGKVFIPKDDEDSFSGLKYIDNTIEGSGLYVERYGVAVDGFGDKRFHDVWDNKLNCRADDKPVRTCRCYYPLFLSHGIIATRIMSAWYRGNEYKCTSECSRFSKEKTISLDFLGQFRLATSTELEVTQQMKHENKIRVERGFMYDKGYFSENRSIHIPIATFSLACQGYYQIEIYVDDGIDIGGYGLVNDFTIKDSGDDDIEHSLMHIDYRVVITKSPDEYDICHFDKRYNNDNVDRFSCKKYMFFDRYSKSLTEDPKYEVKYDDSVLEKFPPVDYGDLNKPPYAYGYDACVCEDKDEDRYENEDYIPYKEETPNETSSSNENSSSDDESGNEDEDAKTNYAYEKGRVPVMQGQFGLFHRIVYADGVRTVNDVVMPYNFGAYSSLGEIDNMGCTCIKGTRGWHVTNPPTMVRKYYYVRHIKGKSYYVAEYPAPGSIAINVDDYDTFINRVNDVIGEDTVTNYLSRYSHMGVIGDMPLTGQTGQGFAWGGSVSDERTDTYDDGFHVTYGRISWSSAFIYVPWEDAPQFEFVERNVTDYIEVRLSDEMMWWVSIKSKFQSCIN